MKSHVIYGPPGTGKTTTLVRLINQVIEKNPRSPIVFLSHTRAAAREAVSREGCKLSEDNAMTIHSLCYRACGVSRAQVVTTDRLVAFGDEIGIPISGNSPDSERELEEGDLMLAIYDLARARLTDPMEEYERSDRPGTPKEFAFFCDSYNNWKANFGYVDFTDMLTLYLRRGPELPYSVFFVDEFQDLSLLQNKVLRAMIANAKLFYAAGDDDQAIFTWAGADARGMADFERDYDAQRKILGQSYRIPQTVHALANEVIDRCSERVEKEYAPREEKGEVQRISHLELIDYNQPLTVLYRDRSARAAFENYFIENFIPYETRVGYPSPLQTKPGRTIRMLDRVFRGEEVDPRHVKVLRDRLTPLGVRALEAKKRLSRGHRWSDYVVMPARISQYLDEVGDQEARITMSSIHSYKGSEADHIVLSTGMSQRTYMNLSRNPDEEHRVFYVGITRAKHKLTIVEGENPYDL